MNALDSAKAALLRGDRGEARRLAMLAAASEPGEAGPLWLLGRIDIREGRTDPALRHLALAGEAVRCAGYTGRDLGLRRDMAIAVGRLARGAMPARPAAPSGPPRLFDCFLFNNELRLLDLHLEEADDYVDQFVIVEAAETFTGHPKPLHFQENRARYAKYRDKIRHVVARPCPPVLRYPWMREFWQRHHVVEGLSGLACDDDFVIVGDCDEIPSRRFLAEGLKDFAVLKMRNYRYFLNYLRIDGKKRHWMVSAVARFRYLRATSPAELRFFTARDLGHNPELAVDDAGWHFSSVGDTEFVHSKLAAYSHQENTSKGRADRSRIEREIGGIRGGAYEEGWIAVTPGIEAPVTVARAPERFEDLFAPVDPQAVSDRLEFFVQELQQVEGRRRGPPREPPREPPRRT